MTQYQLSLKLRVLHHFSSCLRKMMIQDQRRMIMMMYYMLYQLTKIKIDVEACLCECCRSRLY